MTFRVRFDRLEYESVMLKNGQVLILSGKSSWHLFRGIFLKNSPLSQVKL